MHTYIRRSFILGYMLMLFVPLVASASPVLRTGESITVNTDQEVAEDFYAAGGSVTMSGTVGGDFYAAGGSVTINGDVGEDAVIAGGTVYLDGSVGDDVRLVGGNLVITESVGGDILVFGGTLRVLSTATVEGDVLFFGGEANISGTVHGNMHGRAEYIRIDGVVQRDVTVTTARPLELGDQANIDGNVTYRSTGDIVRAPGSVVAGDITKEAQPVTDGGGINVLPLLALFFTSLAYLLLFKTQLLPFMRRTIAHYGINALIGFGIALLTPIAAGLLMVSVIGLPIGLALMLGYILVLLVGWSLGGILAGALIARYFEGEVVVTVKWTLIGTLAVALVSYVPVIGPLVLVALGLMTIGTIGNYVYRFVRA